MTFDQLATDILILAEASKERIELIASQFKLEPSEVEALAEFDPTDGKYLSWIVKQVVANKKNPENGFNPEAEGEDVKETLTEYDEVKKKGNFQGKKDINQYARWGEIAADVAAFLDRVAAKVNIDADGAKLMDRDGDYKLIVVYTPQAGHELFSGTKWCVRHKEAFNHYGPPFFLVTRNDAPYLLAHAFTTGRMVSIMDQYDVPYAKERIAVFEKFILKHRMYDIAVAYADKVFPGGHTAWPELQEKADDPLYLIHVLYPQIPPDKAHLILDDVQATNKWLGVAILPQDNLGPGFNRKQVFAYQLPRLTKKQDILTFANIAFARMPVGQPESVFGNSKESDVLKLVDTLLENAGKNLDEAAATLRRIHSKVGHTDDIHSLAGKISAKLKAYIVEFSSKDPEAAVKVYTDIYGSLLPASIATELLQKVKPATLKQYISFFFGAVSRMKKQEEVDPWIVRFDEVPGAEHIISQDTDTAFTYATRVLKQAWPLGEPAIKKNDIKWRVYLTFKASKQHGFLAASKASKAPQVVTPGRNPEEPVVRNFAPRAPGPVRRAVAPQGGPNPNIARPAQIGAPKFTPPPKPAQTTRTPPPRVTRGF